MSERYIPTEADLKAACKKAGYTLEIKEGKIRILDPEQGGHWNEYPYKGGKSEYASDDFYALEDAIRDVESRYGSKE